MKIMNVEEFNKENVFGKGMENKMFAQYFVGESYLNPLTKQEKIQYLLQILLLNLDVETTGTSIMGKKAESK